MKTRINVINADSVEVMISITASLSVWKAIKSQLSKGNIPAIKFSNTISDAIDKVSEQLELE